jgi:hypothetical protein
MSSTAELVAALDVLAGADVSGLSTVELRGELLDLLTASNRLHAELVRRVGAFDARGASVDDAARSTRSWLRAFGRMSAPAASAQVAQARLLRDLPALAEAAAAGRVSSEHLQRVARLSERVGADVVASADPILAEAAARLDPRDLGRACDRLRAHVDPDGAQPDAAADFDRRGITFSAFDGMVLVRGQLDPEGGAALLTAMDAMSVPPGADELRSPAQRRADALVEVGRQVLREGRLSTVGGVRPQIGILVGPEALRRNNSAQADPQPSGPLPQWLRPVGDVVPASAAAAGAASPGSTLANPSPINPQAAEPQAADGVFAGSMSPPSASAGPRSTDSPPADPMATGPAPPGVNLPVPDPVPPWLIERPGDPAFLQWVGEIPDTLAQRIACDYSLTELPGEFLQVSDVFGSVSLLEACGVMSLKEICPVSLSCGSGGWSRRARCGSLTGYWARTGRRSRRWRFTSGICGQQGVRRRRCVPMGWICCGGFGSCGRWMCRGIGRRGLMLVPSVGGCS